MENTSKKFQIKVNEKEMVAIKSNGCSSCASKHLIAFYRQINAPIYSTGMTVARYFIVVGSLSVFSDPHQSLSEP